MLKVDNLVDNVASYLESKIALIKLEAQETAAKVIVKIILYSSIVILSVFALIFASITGALALNHVLESSYLGFLIITGFYILLLVIAIVAISKESLFLKIEESVAGMFNNPKKEDTNGKDNKRNERTANPSN